MVEVPRQSSENRPNMAESAPLQKSIISSVMGHSTIIDILLRLESKGRICNTLYVSGLSNSEQ